MREIVMIALGGAAGATGRFMLSRGINQMESWLLPLGTVAVNIIGAFVLGLFLEIASERMVGVELRGFLALPQRACSLVRGNV